MVGEAHNHRGVQWSKGVETVMIAWPDQAFQGGCDSSSLGVVMILPQLSEYFGESHITSSVNGTCGLDDLPEYFPLHQAGGGRTYVDVLNFTITWEVTAQFLGRFPDSSTWVATLASMCPQCLLTLLLYYQHIILLAIIPFVSVSSSWAPQGQC